ncbi:MAG: hypothetical protein AAGA85_23470 [Bacteroidota bacterium]
MPIHTKSTFDTFDLLSHRLASGQRTFYTRYGDGDVYLLMGKSYRNHTFNELIRREMEESILIDDPGFVKAMCVNYDLDPGMTNGLFTWYPDNDEMADFLSQTYSPNRVWTFEHHFTFPYFALFYPQKFIAFFDAFIRPKKKLFVGGVDQQVAEKLFGPIDEYIKTPIRNAYGQIEDWWPEVLEKASKVELVIPTAGAASKIINKRLWNEGYPGDSIDVGALIDWVDGRRSRKWIKLMGHRINNVLTENARDDSLLFLAYYRYRESYYACRRLWKSLR